MDWTELVLKVGDDAKSIIEADRGQDMSGGKIACFMTEHKSDPRLSWLPTKAGDAGKFKCSNCGEVYGLTDHVKWLASDDNKKAYELLCEIAGETPSDDYKKPVNTPRSTVPVVYEPEPVEKPKAAEVAKIEPLSRKCPAQVTDYMRTRDIDKETLKDFLVSGTDKAIYFNYLSGGNLVKIKGRLIGEYQNGKDKYSPTPKGGTNVLYGQHLYVSQEVLIICEGEIDALSCHQSLKGGGYHKRVLSSSVPSGSGSMGWIESSAEFISNFKQVILVPDADSAGETFLKKAGEKLLNTLEVKYINLKKYKCKDINDMLKSRGEADICSAIGSCDDYLPDFSVNLKNMPAMEEQLGSSATGFYNIDYTLDGLRNKQLTLLAGKSFHGKSTLARQVLAFNVFNKNRVAALMGEEDKFMFRKVFMNQIFRGDPDMFEFKTSEYGNRLYYPTEEALGIFNNQHVPYIGLFNNKHLGSVDKINRLLEWIKFEHNICGTCLFLIDNLAKLTTGSGENLNQLQGDIINMLKDCATQIGVHIIIVVHTKKHVEFIDGDSISGSGNIFNFADNCLIFERIDLIKNNDAKADKMRKSVDPDDMYSGKFTSALTIEKNRNMAKIGSFPMRYNQESNTLHDLYPEQIKYGWTVPGREYQPQEERY